MWDALEHYADPVGELRRARDFVRDGGYLVLTTMTIDTLAVRMRRKRWPWYMRMRLTYFTPETVEAALGRAGWRLAHRHGYAHVVTWDYLLLKLAPSWRGGSAAGRTGLRRLGLSHRTLTVDLGGFITASAEKLRGRPPDSASSPTTRNPASARTTRPATASAFPTSSTSW